MYQQVNKLTDKIRKKDAPIFIEFETMRYCGHVGPENDDEKMSHIESACKKIDNNFIVAKEGMFYNIKQT